MENALSTMKLMPSTKKELKTYVAKAKQEILGGWYNPLQVAGMLKAMEEVVKQLRSDPEIKDAIDNEASKYPDKTIDLCDFTITRSQRSTPDFTGIDSILDNLYKDAEMLKQVIKAREQVVLSGVDPSTGEAFDEVPKKYTSILSISLK